MKGFHQAVVTHWNFWLKLMCNGPAKCNTSTNTFHSAAVRKSQLKVSMCNSSFSVSPNYLKFFICNLMQGLFGKCLDVCHYTATSKAIFSIVLDRTSNNIWFLCMYVLPCFKQRKQCYCPKEWRTPFSL